MLRELQFQKPGRIVGWYQGGPSGSHFCCGSLPFWVNHDFCISSFSWRRRAFSKTLHRTIKYTRAAARIVALKRYGTNVRNPDLTRFTIHLENNTLTLCNTHEKGLDGNFRFLFGGVAAKNVYDRMLLNDVYGKPPELKSSVFCWASDAGRWSVSI